MSVRIRYFLGRDDSSNPIMLNDGNNNYDVSKRIDSQVDLSYFDHFDSVQGCSWDRMLILIAEVRHQLQNDSKLLFGKSRLSFMTFKYCNKKLFCCSFNDLRDKSIDDTFLNDDKEAHDLYRALKRFYSSEDNIFKKGNTKISNFDGSTYTEFFPNDVQLNVFTKLKGSQSIVTLVTITANTNRIDDECNEDSAKVDNDGEDQENFTVENIALSVRKNDNGRIAYDIVHVYNSQLSIQGLKEKLVTHFPHFFPISYQHDELTINYEDRQVMDDQDVALIIKNSKNNIQIPEFYCVVSEIHPVGEPTAELSDLSNIPINRSIQIFPEQMDVAKRLFDRAKLLLVNSDRQTQFIKLNFIIVVPKYNTLKQQTLERIEGVSGLVRSNESSSDLVYLYAGAFSSSGASERLKKDIHERQNELFVLIVDECHYAPTKEAIPIMHDKSVLDKENFLVILISATPYNCLSKNATVHEHNVIHWFEDDLRSTTDNNIESCRTIIEPGIKSSYIGFEYYFRSVAFRIDFTGHLFDIDFTWREFADFESLAAIIESSHPDLRCIFKNQRFELSLRKSGSAERLSIPESSQKLWQGLGFDSPVTELTKDSATIQSTNECNLDTNSTLVTQHIRQDTSFSNIFDEIVYSCPYLLKIKEKVKRQDLPILWENNPIPWTGPSPTSTAMMAAKNGFTIIIDYIFSMAYFGSCRVDNIGIENSDMNFRVALRNDDELLDFVDCAVIFKNMLCRCVYFYCQETNSFCNLGEAHDVVIDLIKQRLRDNSDDDVKDDILAEYLKQKWEAEKAANTTTDEVSWYTETDRIVKLLLTVRDPAPMVLLRVYDNDENRSMQAILRNAMEVCNLVVHRRTSGGAVAVPGFSVIGDITDTKLYDVLEPYYRNEYNIVNGEYGSNYKIKQIPAMKSGSRQTASNIPLSSDLKYEDLAQLPCLIILCEKGRMGDTFPHNLRVLDMRLRTGGTTQCFLQEIGRMCRYPKRDSTDTIEFAVPISDEIMEAIKVKVASILLGDGHRGYIFEDASNRSFLGVAETVFDLKFILEADKLRTRRVETIRMERLAHPLPYALIQPDVHKVVRKAIQLREAQVGELARTQEEKQQPRKCSLHEYEIYRNCFSNRIVNFLNMKVGVDSYLSKTNRIDWDFQTKLKPKSGHYDLDNDFKHDRRLVLAAECQIGKTGAYLHFLSLLRNAIETAELPAPVPPGLPKGSLWRNWEVPNRSDLLQDQQPAISYNLPKSGKYHAKIARQRLDYLFKIAADPRITFKDLVQKYEHTTSRKGLQYLDSMTDIPLPLTFDKNTFNCDSSKWADVIKYINWDHRFETTPYSYGAKQFVTDLKNDWAQYGREFLDRDREMFNAAVSSFGDVNTTDDAEEGYDEPEFLVTDAVYPAMPVQDFYRGQQLLAYPPIIDATTLLSKSNKAENFDSKLSERLVKTGIIRKISDAKIFFPPGKDKFPNAIWIFTPTFVGMRNGTESGAGDKLLAREEVLAPWVRWKDYVEVLIIRSSQLAQYETFYGSTHIIATLPDLIELNCGRICDPDTGGIGYTRLYSQLLAHTLELKSIWLIDDNIQKCWRLHNEGEIVRNGSLSVKEVSFQEIICHIQDVFDLNSEGQLSSGGCNALKKFPSVPEAETLADRSSTFGRYVSEGSASTFEDVVGDQRAYGVIGTFRGSQWKRKVSHPVKVSHSVSSFFLLNVRETVRRGILFPSRPIWEDVEFNNLLDENGLVACKMQMFAHCKPDTVVNKSETDPDNVNDLMVKTIQNLIQPTSGVVIENLSIDTERYLWPQMDELHDALYRKFIKISSSNADQKQLISVVTNGFPVTHQRGQFKGLPRPLHLDTLVQFVFDQSTSQFTDSWFIILPNTKSIITIWSDNKRQLGVLTMCMLVDLPLPCQAHYLVVKITKAVSKDKEIAGENLLNAFGMVMKNNDAIDMSIDLPATVDIGRTTSTPVAALSPSQRAPHRRDEGDDESTGLDDTDTSRQRKRIKGDYISVDESNLDLSTALAAAQKAKRQYFKGGQKDILSMFAIEWEGTLLSTGEPPTKDRIEVIVKELNAVDGRLADVKAVTDYLFRRGKRPDGLAKEDPMKEEEETAEYKSESSHSQVKNKQPKGESKKGTDIEYKSKMDYQTGVVSGLSDSKSVVSVTPSLESSKLPTSKKRMSSAIAVSDKQQSNDESSKKPKINPAYDRASNNKNDPVYDPFL